MRKIIKNSFSCLAVLFFTLSFFSFVSAQEESIVPVEIKDVKITQGVNKIEINAVLFNPNHAIETAPFTHLILLNTIDPLIKPVKEEDLSLPSLIVSAQEGERSDYFSLKPMESKEVNYSLPVTASLPASNYSFYLRFIKSDGEVVGSYDDVVYNLGTNDKNQNLREKSFLAFDQETCFVVGSDGKNYGNNDGPVFTPDESPKIKCQIKNIGKEAVEVYPEIEWKEFFVYGKPSSGQKQTEKSEQVFSFKPGENKMIELSLPKAQKPQVYQALVKFSDRNGEAKSFNMFFRWTVGGASARIDSSEMTSPLKNVYKKGDTLSFSVNYYGSADLFWGGMSEKVSELRNVEMRAKVKNGNGEICGQAVIPLEDISGADLKNKTIDVTLDEKCDNISYDVSLVSGGQKLAGESLIASKISKKNIDYKYFIGGGFLLVLILGLVKTIMKRKNKTIGSADIPIALLFIFVLTGFFISINATTARTERGSSLSGDYGGGWSGNSDTLYSYWGGNDSSNINKLRIKEEKSGSAAEKGYSIYANFNDYFNSGGQAKVYTNYMADDGVCANSSMVVEIKMAIMADGLDEKYVGFAKNGSEDYKKSWKQKYNKSSSKIIDKDFNISPDALSEFYEDDGNGGKKLRGNPVLFVEFRQVGRDSHRNNYYKAGFSSNINKTAYSDRSKAMDAGAVIRIKIPLNLPDPKIDNFSASENPIGYNCKPTLNWTVSDVGSCSASGDWSGDKSASSGAHSETLKAITEDSDYTLKCSQSLGGSGNATRSKTVTVSVNDAPTVTKFEASDYSIKQGEEVTLTWDSNNSSYCVGYTENKTNGWNGENQRETSGSNKVTPYAGEKTYSIICYNSCGGYGGKNSLTISVGTGDGSSSSSFSGGQTCPDNYCSASESCSTCSSDCGSCVADDTSSSSSSSSETTSSSSSSYSTTGGGGGGDGGGNGSGGGGSGLPENYGDADESKKETEILLKEDEDSGNINVSTDYAVIVAKIIDGLDATSNKATIRFNADGLSDFTGKIEGIEVSNDDGISYTLKDSSGNDLTSVHLNDSGVVSPTSARFSANVGGGMNKGEYVFDIKISGKVWKEEGKKVIDSPAITCPMSSNSSRSSCVPREEKSHWEPISKQVSASTKIILKVKRIATHFEEF